MKRESTIVYLALFLATIFVVYAVSCVIAIPGEFRYFVASVRNLLSWIF